MGKKKLHAEAILIAEGIPGLICTGFMTDVEESSGLALAPDPGTFFTHGDHGNKPILYQINWLGEVVQKFKVPKVDNNDWEAISRDDQGRIWIGDHGNNTSERRDLAIYRFDPAQPDAPPAHLFFHYEDQTEFPPANEADYNYDCESMVWRDGQIYLFTRDRGRHRYCRVYQLPAEPGVAIARFIGQYELPGEVTDAALSPNGTQLALLGREQLFLIAVPSDTLVGGAVRRLALPGLLHAEGMTYVDTCTLAITTELGSVFRLALPDFHKLPELEAAP